ncbi:hypothetical protein GCM10010124_32320 [Pilimelia terevasa]|uniref:Uncharacterized protein n=1 Tax=Pilimelia terevasa TaxID=53372 RepID=A0A8J3BUJ6_9ACTN|nr:hypothetical protein [Pilimelia terevasa]GGK37169.1 hypothetical protein GCM10010124_32320 [Pilimelia terevasa]
MPDATPTRPQSGPTPDTGAAYVVSGTLLPPAVPAREPWRGRAALAVLLLAVLCVGGGLAAWHLLAS